MKDREALRGYHDEAYRHMKDLPLQASMCRSCTIQPSQATIQPRQSNPQVKSSKAPICTDGTHPYLKQTEGKICN